MSVDRSRGAPQGAPRNAIRRAGDVLQGIGRGGIRGFVRAAFWLYPRSFRDTVGEDMLVALERERASVQRQRGGLAAASFLARNWLTMVGDALGERFDRSRTRPGGRVSFGGNRNEPPASGGLRGGRGDRLVADAGYALRVWRRSPGHALVAVAALSIGIGVNVAVINLIDTLFFSEPPVSEPHRLLQIVGRDQRQTSDAEAFSTADLEAVRAGSTTLEEVAAEGFFWGQLGTGESSVELPALFVTGNYFPMLGMRPAAGRFFGPDEDRLPGRDAVAVISHRVWSRQFSRDPGIVGTNVRLNRRPFTIVGVTPPGFRGLYASQSYDLWIPRAMSEIDEYGATYARDFRAFDLIARRAPGSSEEESAAEIEALVAALAVDSRDDRVGAFVRPVRGATPGARRSVGRTPLVALAVAGALLAITWMNLAGMVLARNVERRAEFATRRALGASAGVLRRQLTTEALVLAGAAGVVGAASALWTGRLIEQWYAYDLPGLELRMGAAAGWGALGMVAATSLLLGVIPAWRAARSAAVGDMGSRGVAGAGRFLDSPFGVASIIVQVALSLMLLMGAAVMLQTVSAILVSAGSDPGGVLHYRLRPSRVGYDEAAAVTYRHDLLRRVAALAGVESAALARVGPEYGFCCVEGVGTPESASGVRPLLEVHNNDVTPAFFDALGIPLVRGRAFDQTDGPGAPPVAVVNEALGERLWPGRDPIGQALVARGRQYRVVGVAPDMYPSRAGEGPVPYLYFAYEQSGLVDGRLYVRVRGDTGPLQAAVREVVASVDPDVHIGQEGTLEERMRLSMAAEQTLTGVLRVCAIAAVVLSAIGLYGQLSLSVGQRRREIGIRMALGSTTSRVVGEEVRRGLRLLATGLAAGLVAVWAQARLLSAYVAGVGAGEPLLLAAACGIVLLVGVAATLLPARRAAEVDPIQALRQQ